MTRENAESTEEIVETTQEASESRMSDNNVAESNNRLTPEQVAEALRQGLTNLDLLKEEVRAADAATSQVKEAGEREIEDLKNRVNAEVAAARKDADAVRARYDSLGQSLVSDGLMSHGLLETMGHTVKKVTRPRKK